MQSSHASVAVNTRTQIYTTTLYTTLYCNLLTGHIQYSTLKITDNKYHSESRILTFENELFASVFLKVSLSREYTREARDARTVAALGVLYSRASSPKLLPSSSVATTRPFTSTWKEPISIM